MNRMKNRIIIIFSGYNQRAVIAFLRTLKMNNIENYAIIAASCDDSILNSEYKEKVFYIRKIKQLDLEEALSIFDKLKKLGDEFLIAPSTEALDRFLLDYRIQFEAKGCIIPLVDKELYEKISNKESFYNLCNDNGLMVPQIYDNSFDNWPIPFVAKPKKYISSNGKQYSPIIIYDENHKKDFIENYRIEDFDIQEYICGRSFYLLYYFPKNGKPLRFSQENYCQQPGGKSILIAASADVHNMKIADKYEELLLSEKYHGFIMVEVRENLGDYYMIEANPRFWGPSQLFVDAGVNFFILFLQEYGFKINRNNKYHAAKYMWLDGFASNPETNTECVWFNAGKDIFLKNKKEFYASDIFNREDTLNMCK